ncbi:MAG: 2-amino-4-hydroxy-6-hydroxymethyldihydropteridine diphosphokinase [Actinomycetota bacterium]|nr:2-amino-4-hydroxy-6-hydroxymethyldihydropteridine diphosphokinase [Actinomycetota bacterium]
MSVAYIGLGSNIGFRDDNIKRAVEELDAAADIKVTKVSSIYETKPVGYLDQPDFLNAVVEIETTLTPRQLLVVAKSIEKQLERRHDIHWGPRTIDLDILLVDLIEMDEADLNLPHPEVKKRAFVLVPLAEIAPELRLPGGKQVRELLTDLGKIEGVKMYKQELSRLDLLA